MSEAENLVAMLREGGEAALAELIDSRASEALYLDFKRSAGTGGGRRLHDSDRENLAKAISAFGNTAGGVIVWGIDCRPHDTRGDVAHQKVPVPNVAHFKSLLEGAVAGSTIPSHSGVEHHIIATLENGSGYVATLVPPASNPPLQVPGLWRYYMRVGANFEPMPHAIIGAMFGRRPEPQLAIAFTSATLNVMDTLVESTLPVYLQSEGPGIARDIFLHVEYADLPCDGTSLTVTPMKDSRMGGLSKARDGYSVMSNVAERFPPGSRVGVLFITVRLTPTITRDLTINISAGCENGPPTYRTLTQARSRLTYAHRHATSATSSASKTWLADRIFGVAVEPTGISASD